MKRIKLLAVLFALVVSMSFVKITWAAQYIDPNTGGMLFQFLAVAFGLASGLVLVFYGRIKMFVARAMRQIRERRNGEDATADEE